MKVINQGYEILTPISEGGIEELKRIERIGRICYKSEDKISPDGESAKKFVKMLIDKGHEAMIEHSQLSVLFVCDRGVSHELVRHRLCSFAQESTRYCNYSREDKNPDGIIFIKPFWLKEGTNEYREWETVCQDSEFWYLQALKHGQTPQQARAILINSVKTEIVVTGNYREFRHLLKLRCDQAAHPQMREIMVPLLAELKQRIPVVFDDIFV